MNHLALYNLFVGWSVCLTTCHSSGLRPPRFLSMEFSRQEYSKRLPFPTPEDLLNPGIEPMPLVSPALAGRFFTTDPPGHFIFKTLHSAGVLGGLGAGLIAIYVN